MFESSESKPRGIGRYVRCTLLLAIYLGTRVALELVVKASFEACHPAVFHSGWSAVVLGIWYLVRGTKDE